MNLIAKFLLRSDGDLERVLHGWYSIVDINHLDDINCYVIWILMYRS